MRREIVGLRKSLVAAIAAAGVVVLLPEVASAQSLPVEIVSLVEQMAEEGDESSVEELLEKYQEMIRNPVNINSLNREDLERIGLFSLFQIESLIEYRGEFGDILSSGELMMVDGFSESFVKTIVPFITFSSDSPIGKPVSEPRSTNTLIAKGKKKWGEEGINLSSKYKFESSFGISGGVTIDSDAEERLTKYYLPDFSSAYIEYNGERALKQLVVGDYTAKFGQGLLLWKAFGVSPFGAPASSIKKEGRIKGYTSTDESNFLRGAAASFGWNGFETTCFISANSVDARVVGDTSFTSIVTGGKHITDSEIEKRHTMREYLVGGNLSYTIERWRLGLTAVSYCYDKKNGRRVQEYNKYQMYDGLWGNVGFDFYTYYRNFRIFGEVAVDFTPAFAALAGVLWSPSYNFEISTMLRSYSKRYIATHAGAYSTLSSCSNQNGVTVSLKYIFSKKWSLLFNSDNSYYPHDRFRVEGSSYALKGRVALQYDIGGGSSLLLQSSYSYKSESSFTWKWRANLNYSVGRRIKLGCRVEGNQGGFGAFVDGSFRTLNKKFEASARFTCYNTDGWDSRIYIYERNVPQSFAVEAYSGKGMGGYLVLKYSPIHNIDLYLKGSDNYCAFFIRIFIPG